MHRGLVGLIVRLLLVRQPPISVNGGSIQMQMDSFRGHQIQFGQAHTLLADAAPRLAMVG